MEKISAEKKDGILIAGSVSTANRIIRRKAETGSGVFGIRSVSIRDLAFETMITGLHPDAKPVKIGRDDAVALLAELFHEKKDLSFIPEESICGLTLLDVYDKICQLRGGLAADNGSVPGAGELFRLIKYFETALIENEYYDECRSLQEAIKVLDKKGSPGLHIALTCDRELNALQDQFLKKVTEGGSLSIVSYAGDFTDISEKNVRYFKGFGKYNEVQHCLNVIREEKLLYGDTAILCSHPSYIPYIEAILGGSSVPFTLASQKSVLHFRRLEMVDEVLMFAEEGYDYELLRPLFEGYGLVLKDEDKTVFKEKLYFDAIRLGIAINRDESLARVKNAIEKTEENASSTLIFYRFLEQLLLALPEGESPITPCALFDRVYGVLKEHFSGSLKKENAAAESAVKKVRETIRRQREMPPLDAIHLIRTTLSDSVINEKHKGDAVEIVPMGSVYLTDRNNLFFIGLSASTFIQDLIQSPVLSDEALKQLVPEGSVRFSSDKGLRFTETLMTTLRCLGPEKNLWFGASVYDAVRLKKDTAAPVYYELLDRFAPDPDYEDIPLFEYEEITSLLSSTDKEATGETTITRFLLETSNLYLYWSS